MHANNREPVTEVLLKSAHKPTIAHCHIYMHVGETVQMKLLGQETIGAPA